MINSLAEYVITDHARFEMTRRGITDEMVSQVLVYPDQVEPVRVGRNVYHVKIEIGDPPKCTCCEFL